MPNRAHTRKDPLKGKKEFSTNKGFTVIELMIAVGVLAVLMSLALPSYRTLIEKRQVTSSAQQLAAFLSAAKMEAVKRNQNVRLQKDSEASCIGFASYAINASPDDAECDCTVTVPTASDACSVENLDTSLPELRSFQITQILDNSKIEAVNIGSNDTDVVAFDAVRGLLTVDGAVDGLPIEIQLTSKHDKYAMNVRVSATGRVTMCSDQDRAEFAVPGYDDC